MKRWTIKRKYKAFVELDKLLRLNFADDCARARILGLPQEAADKEELFIREFLEAVTNSDSLLQTPVVRQFLEVPLSRSLFDLSNDPTRSIFSSTIGSFLGKTPLPPSIPPSLSLADLIMLFTVIFTALPLFAGIPFDAQPFAASWAMIVCAWYISQKEGLFDFLMEKIWGAELVPYARSMVRPADMPGFWITVGVIVGFAFGGHKHAGFLYVTGVFCTRIMVILAVANFAFITGVATDKIKVH
jgi:hypothetical protein